MPGSRLRTALYGGLLTVVALLGGVALGIAFGSVTFNLLPGHSQASPAPAHMAVAVAPALGAFLLGSALWGMWIGRLVGHSDRGRLARAGMLGFAPITLGLIFLLQFLEPIAVGSFAGQLPIHRIFTLFFVPTAFLIAGVGAWAVGRTVSSAAAARDLFWQVGVAAALAFLVVNLLMEALGWQVGGPNAAARATMLTVMFAGNAGAALAGGAWLGWRLHAARPA
jgi:hypothetical protein